MSSSILIERDQLAEIVSTLRETTTDLNFLREHDDAVMCKNTIQSIRNIAHELQTLLEK